MSRHTALHHKFFKKTYFCSCCQNNQEKFLLLENVKLKNQFRTVLIVFDRVHLLFKGFHIMKFAAKTLNHM